MEYSIGIQTFKELRKQNYIYVDKTQIVYELVHDFKYTLLCRPSGFGKSLLLTTLQTYFEGNKEYFKGLANYELEKEWKKYPVIYLDFTHGLFNSVENFQKHLSFLLGFYEDIYGTNPHERLLCDRLTGIIRRAHEAYKLPVVILFDAYDMPIVDSIGLPGLQKKISDELSSLFSVLKCEERYIKFAMLTGVQRFGDLSVFDGLNNLTDISLHNKYTSICGFTQEEIDLYYDEPVSKMARSRGLSKERMKEELMNMYGGYRFTQAETKLYNPCSLLKALKFEELGSFWYDSNSPDELIRVLKDGQYNLSILENASAEEFQLSRPKATDSSNIIPILYQKGYLTIKDYNQSRKQFILGFPNKEVRKGFLEYAFPYYSKTISNKFFNLNQFVDYLHDGKPTEFINLLMELIRDLPYEFIDPRDVNLQNLIYTIFNLASSKSVRNLYQYKPSMEMLVTTVDYAYLFKIKNNSKASKVIEEINTQKYLSKEEAAPLRIFKIGVTFKTFGEWEAEYSIEPQFKGTFSCADGSYSKKQRVHPELG